MCGDRTLVAHQNRTISCQLNQHSSSVAILLNAIKQIKYGGKTSVCSRFSDSIPKLYLEDRPYKV